MSVSGLNTVAVVNGYVVTVVRGVTNLHNGTALNGKNLGAYRYGKVHTLMTAIVTPIGGDFTLNGKGPLKSGGRSILIGRVVTGLTRTDNDNLVNGGRNNHVGKLVGCGYCSV